MNISILIISYEISNKIKHRFICIHNSRTYCIALYNLHRSLFTTCILNCLCGSVAKASDT